MPRQILTLALVFFGVMVVMKGCPQSSDLPPAVLAERIAEPDAAKLVRLEGAEPGLVADFDPLGRLVTLRRGDAVIVRAVNGPRRPFNVAVRYKSGAARIVRAADGWSSKPAEGGGRLFLFEKDGFTVRKTVRFAAAGDALEVRLEVEGAPAEVEAVEFTGLAGVELAGARELNRSAMLWQFEGDKPKRRSVESLRDERERRRQGLLALLAEDKTIPPNPSYVKRLDIGRAQKLQRLGIVGHTHFVALIDVAAASAFNIDLYRGLRDETESDELESWLTLPVTDTRFGGDFTIRWEPRTALDAAEGGASPARTFTVENDVYRALFTDRGAALLELWLKSYSTDVDRERGEETWIPMLRRGVRSGWRALSMRTNPDRVGVDASEASWNVEPAATSIRFTLASPTGWSFEKTVTLPAAEEGFELGVELRIRRPDAAPDESVKYTLVGPAGSYLEDAFRDTLASDPPAGMILERRGEDEDRDLEEIGEDPLVHTYEAPARRGLARAVLVRGGYFNTALVTEERTDADGRPAGVVVRAEVKRIQLQTAFRRPNGESSNDSLLGAFDCEAPLEDGATAQRYRLYAGPNSREHLRPLHIEESVDFGFFGAIGRGLMALMKLLEGLVGSFGVAIMLMTLFVRAALMPISYKTQLGMQRYSKRIQKIKPQLEELEKKYGNNRQKLNQERMRIMKENKVGLPLGCLTMFLQIPIWIALFQALRVEFALRHTPFLWAPDLSMPDHLFALPFWPHAFNLLPILMLVLWTTQQRLTPSPGGNDPQMQAQMKMMRFMPYIFFFMLYKYAAALALYMCVSSAWGIVEARLVRKAIANTSDEPGPAPA